MLPWLLLSSCFFARLRCKLLEGVINLKGSVVKKEREKQAEGEIIKRMRCRVVKVLVGA